MAQLDWGKENGIGLHFADDAEYYETLGYIANSRHGLAVYTHENQRSGARAMQGKLEAKNGAGSIPAAVHGLRASFDQSGDDRLSVTDYVENLARNHAFGKRFDPTGREYTYYIFPESSEAVRQTVPDEYLADYERGFAY